MKTMNLDDILLSMLSFVGVRIFCVGTVTHIRFQNCFLKASMSGNYCCHKWNLRLANRFIGFPEKLTNIHLCRGCDQKPYRVWMFPLRT